MSWYKTGTVAVTNGSTTIGGSGTVWAAPSVLVGDAFIGPDGGHYEITSVNTTQLVISPAYSGSTGSGTYRIMPTQDRNLELAESVTSFTSLANAQIDTLPAWKSAREAELNAAWRSDNDGAGSGLDADLLDGHQAAAFMRRNSNTIGEWTDIGVFEETSNLGAKRLNFKLNGVPQAACSWVVRMDGLAYGAGKALSFIFTGYNWGGGQITSANSIDLSSSGLTFGMTQTAAFDIYLWFELPNTQYTTLKLVGMPVRPAGVFVPAAGFTMTASPIGVAIT